MAATKKSFFGSLFAFQPIAVEELRSGFRDKYKLKVLSGHPPLLSYDQRNFSFSFECQQHDVEPPKLFRQLLTDYIAEHQNEGDLLENQRIVPIGTYFNGPIFSNDQFSLDDDQELLPISDSDGSDEESGIPGSIGYQTEVWKPTLGHVDILTFDVQKALLDLTGCTISIYKLRNEAKLHGGQLRDALSRLKTIEPILTLLQNRVNEHVLLISSATDNTRIDFTMPSDAALRRIIVDPDVKSVKVWLGNKCIEQLTTYAKAAKADAAIVTPKNLTNPVPCSTGIESSTIWSDYEFSQIGDIKNRASVGDTPAFSQIEKLDPLPISQHMTESESHTIRQWAERVVKSTDPDKVDADTVVVREPSEKPGRTRLKRADNDDEEEEEEGEDEKEREREQQKQDQKLRFNPLTMPSRSMNDALNNQFNVLSSKFGRTRIKREDDDDNHSETENKEEDANEVEEEEEKEKEEKADRGRWSRPSKRVEGQQVMWANQPIQETQQSGHRNKYSKDKPGRRRVVKVDSDEELEPDGWGVPTHDNADENENGSLWGNTPLQSGAAETSNDWDATIYPDASFAGGRTLPVQQEEGHHSHNGWQNESTSEPTWDMSAAPLAEGWSDSPSMPPPDDISQITCHNNGSIQEEEQGAGAGDQAITLTSSSLKNSLSHSGHEDNSELPKPESNRRRRARSSRSGSRRDRSIVGSDAASSVSTPSALKTRRSDLTEPRKIKPNPFATDEVFDISDSAATKTHTLLSANALSGSGNANSHTPRQAVASGEVTDTGSGEELVDVSTPEAAPDTPIAPPPGFGSFTRTTITNSQQHGASSSLSDHGGSSAGSRPEGVPPMPSTAPLQTNQADSQMKSIEKVQRRAEELQLQRLDAGNDLPDPSADKLQDVDEVGTRMYHQTMNQGASNPSPSKKATRQKRAGLLESAWNVNRSASQAKADASNVSQAQAKAQDLRMSAAKKKLLTEKERMASSNHGAAFEEQSLLQTSQLIAAFHPVFQSARAFAGALKFEIQLGQFLSPCPEGAYQAKCVTVNQWHKLYDSPHGKLSGAGTFANILTRNGSDIDHILKLKTSKSEGNTTLFHRDDPGRGEVCFEFHCRGKNNDDFKIVLGPKGEHHIEHPFRAIGQVNLHIPGQIWDAAGLLTGSTNFHEGPILTAAVEELIKSVFIPGGRKEIELSYRLPVSNEFAVKKVFMRRTSRHACAVGGKSDLQLQITEVLRLFVEYRPNGVYLAYSSKYEKMVDQMMVHFEVSLISHSISQVLSANANLTLGDTTRAWTAESILEQSRIKNLLDLTRTVVSKIDGIGFHNVGSAIFILNDSILADGSTAVAANPTLNPMQNCAQPTPRPMPMPVSRPLTKPTTTQQNNLTGPAYVAVPGVRGGVAHPTAQGYAVGYGGARIPLVPQQQQQQPQQQQQQKQSTNNTDGVVPDDSASQAPERKRGRRGRGGGAANKTDVVPGFW